MSEWVGRIEDDNKEKFERKLELVIKRLEKSGFKTEIQNGKLWIYGSLSITEEKPKVCEIISHFLKPTKEKVQFT